MGNVNPANVGFGVAEYEVASQSPQTFAKLSIAYMAMIGFVALIFGVVLIEMIRNSTPTSPSSSSGKATFRGAGSTDNRTVNTVKNGELFPKA